MEQFMNVSCDDTATSHVMIGNLPMGRIHTDT